MAKFDADSPLTLFCHKQCHNQIRHTFILCIVVDNESEIKRKNLVHAGQSSRSSFAQRLFSVFQLVEYDKVRQYGKKLASELHASAFSLIAPLQVPSAIASSIPAPLSRILLLPQIRDKTVLLSNSNIMLALLQGIVLISIVSKQSCNFSFSMYPTKYPLSAKSHLHHLTKNAFLLDCHTAYINLLFEKQRASALNNQ